MEREYNNKLMTLSDGYQYIVIEQTDYMGNKYVVANEIREGKIGSNYTLFRVEQAGVVPNFIEEKDLDLVATVLAKLVY